MFAYLSYKSKTHRIIPSRYPTVSPFDWAESTEEIEQLAVLEGLTNDRIKGALGNINLVNKEDWIAAEGASPLMSPFTHPGYSRFSDGSFGIYYTSDSLKTAVTETKFHRKRFLQASNEPPCQVQMREYTAYIVKKMIDIRDKKYCAYLNPDIASYPQSQQFGKEMKLQNEWGLMYSSVRKVDGICFAILRPSALTIPVQGCHLEYIWDGTEIIETNVLKVI
ncbi:MAG: RES family NAD+ phosphorylase [Gammaproteobacteria bacterium]|nr:RES family NAD+ phosphorylase [Gammaproteobacteria bacterium]